jgi:hypothetical protein
MVPAGPDPEVRFQAIRKFLRRPLFSAVDVHWLNSSVADLLSNIDDDSTTAPAIGK